MCWLLHWKQEWDEWANHSGYHAAYFLIHGNGSHVLEFGNFGKALTHSGRFPIKTIHTNGKVNFFLTWQKEILGASHCTSYGNRGGVPVHHTWAELLPGHIYDVLGIWVPGTFWPMCVVLAPRLQAKFSVPYTVTTFKVSDMTYFMDSWP